MKNVVFVILIIVLLFSCKKNYEINQKFDNIGNENINENDDFLFLEYDRNVQFGNLLYEKNPGNDWDNIVEIVFINPLSKKELYYLGEKYRGNGAFLINENNKKNIIFEIPIIYGPKIIWHGENIAEIFRPSGSPFYESYFYDFVENKISREYEFPLYFDVEEKIVLIWGRNDFEIYDIQTGKLIKEYNYRRTTRMTAAWPYIKYYIKKENGNILLNYDDWDNKRKGQFVFSIKR